MDVRRAHAEADEPRQGADPGASGRRRAVTKRDVIRHYAGMAPAMLPYLHDRPINLHRYPDGVDKGGFWHKARPSHAPDFVGVAGATPTPTRARPRSYAVLDNPAALAWAANFGAIELHPWTSTVEQPHRPTWAMVDIDPGTVQQLRRCRHAGPAAPHGARTPRRRGMSQGHRQSRHPDLDPGRQPLYVRRHPAWVENLSRIDRRHRARAGELGVGEVEAQGARSTRLHAERDQQDPRRAVQPAARDPVRRCRPRSRGTSSTIRRCGRIDGTSRTSVSACGTSAIPWPL